MSSLIKGVVNYEHMHRLKLNFTTLTLIHLVYNNCSILYILNELQKYAYELFLIPINIGILVLVAALLSQYIMRTSNGVRVVCINSPYCTF